MTEPGAASPSVLGDYGVIQLSYYHPWVYAGSERYHQLALAELRMGRGQVYVYVSDAGAGAEIGCAAADPKYARFALYQFEAPTLAVPRSAYAVALTGQRRVSIEELVATARPDYLRIPFPVRDFVTALKTDQLRSVPVVYDVMDLWAEFPVKPWGSNAVEDFYLQRADALTLVSRALADRFATPQKFIVPNAVDPLFLRRISPSPEGSARAPGSPVRVLYLGNMGGSWFDWELVLRLTTELPKHHFTFLGSALLPPEEMRQDAGARVARLAARLVARPNVTMVAEVPHDQIAPWLLAADVGIIPFRPTELTKAVSPLKVFEYLGAGCPVVQLGMPDIESYPGVRTARCHDEFIDLVRSADRSLLHRREAEKIAKFAERNTWTQRVTAFDRIADLLRGRTRDLTDLSLPERNCGSCTDPGRPRSRQ